MRPISFPMLAMLFTGGCLPGCGQQNVREAYGYSNPTLTASKTAFGGFRVEIPTNFSGDAHVEYDPGTGYLKGDITVSSEVSGVLDAEGRRITPEFLEGRRIEWTGTVELHKVIGANAAGIIQAFGLAVAANNPLMQNAAATMLQNYAATLPVTLPAPKPVATPTTQPDD